MIRRSVLVTVCFALGSAEAAPSVGVDVSRLDCAVTDVVALEQSLVMRLLQDGFMIVPLTREPSIVVGVAGREQHVVLSVKSAHFVRSRTVDVTASGAQLQLELVQRAIELARLAREAEPPPPRADRELPAALRVVVPPREQAPRWQLGAGIGVLADRTVESSLHARYAIAHGFGAVVRASAVEQNAATIDVKEQDLLAGPGYEVALSDSLALDVALLVGVRRHEFELAMTLPERTGTRLDGALALPLRIVVRPWRALEVSAWGITKLARSRDHLNRSDVLWRREALGFGAGAGVGARF